MNQELIAYLDANFEGIAQRFEGIAQRSEDLQGQMNQRFEDFQGQMNQRFEDFQGQMNQRFENMQGQMNQRFEDVQGQMDRRFDKTDKQIRRTNVVVEGLRSEIQAVAEGHAMLSDKMDQIYGELKVERRQDRDENRSALRRLRRRDDELEVRVRRLEAG